MVVEVWVGADQASLEQAIREAWVVRQITRRRSDGESVCFRVRIAAPSVELPLGTPECGVSVGGGRAPTEAEKQILELWQRHGLNSPGFSPGQALAFLKELERVV